MPSITKGDRDGFDRPDRIASILQQDAEDDSPIVQETEPIIQLSALVDLNARLAFRVEDVGDRRAQRQGADPVSNRSVKEPGR